MNIYAESSAVLAWLLGEVAGGRVREALRRADLVFASDLVLIECDCVLIRAVALREIDEATAANRRAHLNAAAAHWHMYRLSLDIVERARRAFPVGTRGYPRRDSLGIGIGRSFHHPRGGTSQS